MCKKVFFYLFIFVSLVGYSQDDEVLHWINFSNDLHQMRQLEGTNENIIEFFEKTELIFTNDTVYFIFVPPMRCSRCEGVINPFITEIKNINPDAKVVLLAFYPKTGALEYYLKKRKFRADYVIALTDLTFLDNFYFSAGHLQVPYITKFNISSGDLIIGKSTLGLSMNSEFAHWINNCYVDIVKYKPQKQNQQSEYQAVPEIHIDEKGLQVMKPVREIVLGEEEGYPISKAYYPSFDDQIEHFSFMDELTCSIYLYKCSEIGAVFLRALEPTTEEENLFRGPDIDDTMFMVLKQMNIINTMFFSNTFIGDSLVISASLPDIFWENKAMEHIAYYNKITYLYRDVNTGDLIRYVTPENIADSLFTIDHQSTFIINDGKLICIPVSKGWPISGTEMLNKEDSLNNPFIESFYDFTPILAVYDRNGKFLSYIGKLDDVFKSKKVGYSFSKPMIRYKKGIYWYTDTYNGVIYGQKSLKSRKPAYRIKVFDLPEYESPINQKKNPLEYIKDYRNLFNQAIIDFQIKDNKILTVIKINDFYFYKVFNFKGKLISEKILPTVYDNMDISTYIIKTYEERIKIIGIFESSMLTSILIFE